MRQRDQGSFLSKLWKMEASLVASGMPAMPDWWRRTVERFYLSGKRRLVVRKGRRVFASTCVAPRLAVAEMIFGEHKHLPGTPPIVYAFLSVKRGEAANRLKGVAAILDALGVKYAQRGDNIELVSYPAIFSVVTANFRTSVGETVGFAWCDELARWRDDESGANPAEQVVGSLAPALATLPDARLFLVSTPLGKDDYHARQFDLGSTDLQETAFGATWEINPTLTKEETRKLEPDERIWQREYGGIPSASVSAALDPDLIEEAFRAPRPGSSSHQSVGIVDASSGGGDAFAYGVVGYLNPPLPAQFIEQRNIETGELRLLDHRTRETLVLDPSVLSFHTVNAFEGRFKGQISAAEVIRQIAAEFRRWGVRTVVGDQREAFFVSSEMAKHGLRFHELPWTNANKVDAVRRVRDHLGCRSIIFPPGRQKLKKELLSYSERITASGAITYSARGAGHDDEVSLVMTAAMAELERLIPGSPLYVPNGRITLSGH